VDSLRVFLRRSLTGIGAIIVLLSLLRFDVPPRADLDSNLDRLLAGQQFAFVSWWTQAFGGKLLDELTRWQDGMTQVQQAAFVRTYMRSVSDFQMLEGQINAIYVDPKVADKTAATASLRAQRDSLRESLNTRQNVAEALLQEQVESVLRQEGFAIGGQVWPPVRFRFTTLPNLLVVSRRDKIERIASRELKTGLTVDQEDRIERSVSDRFDVSSLVTPIGGLGAYPTMLPETSALQWTLSTIAHEWTHNYLLARFSPIALNYSEDARSRIMNETTAVIVQNEIGPRVVARYYPELKTTASLGTVFLPWHATPELEAARAPIQIAASTTGTASTGDRSQIIDPALEASLTSDTVASMSSVSSVNTRPDQPDQPDSSVYAAFDFRAQMRETRVRTDELLAAGKVAEAEAYMEQRRQVFVTNGYPLRKLNQAYFAFYGAYNAEPGGAPAAGRDRTGPAVQRLRKQSATLGDFVRTMALVQNFDDLLKRLR